MQPLTPVQVRVLGCLVEKERTTPDNYPLTMNGLLTACNQTTNRSPVVTFTEAVVSNAIVNLRADNLVRIDHSRSNRADKYRHVLDQVLGVGNAEVSLLAVLMLRGPQTVAELRARTERLHRFAGPDEVDEALARLATRSPAPLAVRLAPLPGHREARWAHLLAGDVGPEELALASASPPGGGDGSRGQSRTERIEALEDAVAVLQAELAELRAEVRGSRERPS
ncbi:MAG: YceH family protein [Actinomycetota bacterium]